MLDKIKPIFHSYGTANGLLYLMQAVMARLSIPVQIANYRLFLQPVTLALPHQAKPGSSISIRQIDQAEYRVEWFERPAEIIEQRYRQGARCFVAFDRGTPIGCLWLCFNSYLEDTVRCNFVLCPKDKVVWDFDVYVAPKYRLGRTFLYLWEAAREWLRNQGFEWTASRIDAFNINSLNSHRRMGAVQVGAAVFVACRNWQIMLANVQPYFHFSVATGKLPEVVVVAPKR